MKKYYEILGLTEEATLEDVNEAFLKISAELYRRRRDNEISRAEYVRMYDEADLARDFIISEAKNKAADEVLFRDVEESARREAEKSTTGETHDEDDVEVLDATDDKDNDVEEEYRDYYYEEPKKLNLVMDGNGLLVY